PGGGREPGGGRGGAAAGGDLGGRGARRGRRDGPRRQMGGGGGWGAVFYGGGGMAAAAGGGAGGLRLAGAWRGGGATLAACVRGELVPRARLEEALARQARLFASVVGGREPTFFRLLRYELRVRGLAGLAVALVLLLPLVGELSARWLRRRATCTYLGFED